MKVLSLKKRRRTITLVIFALLLASMAIAGSIALLLQQTTPVTSPTQVNESSDKVDDTSEPTVIKMAAMGDMLAHDTIINNALTGESYNFRPYFQHIRPLYSDSDIVFCNQEGPSAGSAYGISGYPTFNAPVEFSSDLKNGAGCNLINLANNHLGDKGTDATNTTIDQWANLRPLAFAGANKSSKDQEQVAYAEVKGVKISFLAFADFNNNRSTPGYSVNIYHDTALFNKLLKEARANSDIVIVSMHWGTEDSSTINADQKRQVAAMASLGVDLVIGTGPHVLQPVEVIKRPDGKDMVVWYSLGNMLSSQLYIPQLFSGIATLDFIKDPETHKISIQNLGFIPTYMHYEWTALQQANDQLLARKNPMVYPLSDAAEALSKSNHNTTIKQQRDYIVSILGSKVTVR